MLNLDGLQIHIEDSGDGIPVVFVPGSYSTPTAWRSIQVLLPGQYRVVGTSLNGYGRTAETRKPGDAGIEHAVHVVRSVVQSIGEPVHLVGHSWGGYIALATALGKDVELRSLSLFEANPIPLIKGTRPDLFARTQLMATDFISAHHRGDSDAASLIIDFWGGVGSFACMPPRVQEYCRASTAANVFDWQGALAAQINLSMCERLDLEILLVRSDGANDVMLEISRVLAEHLPKVRAEVINKANHFLISSHPQQCAALLAAHWAQHGV